MSQEQVEEKTDNHQPPRIDDAEGRAVLDTQIQILRRINDELLRTLRLHAVFGGVVVTALSVIGVNGLKINSVDVTNQVFWLLSFSATLFAPMWVLRLLSERVSYSELTLGIHPDPQNMPQAEKDHAPTRGIPEKTIDFFTAIGDGILTLLFPKISVEASEEDITQEEVAGKMLKENYTDAIYQNTWVLQTREDYVNSVQNYLSATFIIYVFGLAGMYVF
ncbi:hypothetical protein [Halorussus sp. AFM4]|uniref:hypothetical protein n=1 Tax=Halorussus sp. AFM4 TaxID=3421651 RepID=UPI003EBA3C21